MIDILNAIDLAPTSKWLLQQSTEASGVVFGKGEDIRNIWDRLASMSDTTVHDLLSVQEDKRRMFDRITKDDYWYAHTWEKPVSLVNKFKSLFGYTPNEVLTFIEDDVKIYQGMGIGATLKRGNLVFLM